MDSMVSASDKSGRHILQDFLRKVLRLGANRLHDLCGRLDLQDANREEIETQVNSCLALLLGSHVVMGAEGWVLLLTEGLVKVHGWQVAGQSVSPNLRWMHPS